MNNTITFNDTSDGSITFDFNIKKVIFNRRIKTYVPSIEVPFSEITDIEYNPAKFMTLACSELIVNNKRLKSNTSSLHATHIHVKKSDSQALKEALERLASECNLLGLKPWNSIKVPLEVCTKYISDIKKNDNDIDKAIEEEMALLETLPTDNISGEHRMRCNVCGHIFCYTNADIKKNVENAKSAMWSSVAQIAGSIGGAHAASAVNQTNAQNSLNRIVDYSRCPSCHSSNISEIKGDLSPEKSETPTTAVVSSVEEIKQYKELLDMGVITQEEFDAKKKQLLGL